MKFGNIFESGGRKQGNPDVEQERDAEKVFLHNGEERVRYLYESGFLEESRLYEKVCRFAEAIAERGGKALLTGGSVRDELIGVSSKDYDIEVYGVEPDDLIALTKEFGKVSEVGASFGVLKLQIDGFEIDVSLPRRESSTGSGHRDFSVNADPHMSLEDACRRRDFTINALVKDVLTGEVHDFFGGVRDLKERRLCITDHERFGDDPLRVLRGVQFVGRFGLFMEDETSVVIRDMRSELEHLAKERFAEEWTKLLLRSKKPSLGLNAAMELGIFHQMHPEITKLPLTPQEHKWHPEGDVWVHTLMVVDEAAKIVEQEQLGKEDALVVMLSAFCHDFGKPLTTEEVDGKIRAHGHEEAGEEPSDRFMREIGIAGSVREKVKKLVIEHLKPVMFYAQEERGQKVTDGAIKKLADRLHPATMQQLVCLAKADALGRGPFVDPDCPERSFMPADFPAGEWLLKRCAALGVEKEKPKPVLFGRDLIAFGFKPGPTFGKILTFAETMHISGLTREEILSRIDRGIHAHKEQHGTAPSLEDMAELLHEYI